MVEVDLVVILVELVVVIAADILVVLFVILLDAGSVVPVAACVAAVPKAVLQIFIGN